MDNLPECGLQRKIGVRREISRLKMRSLITHAFRNPISALHNDSLSEQLVYSQQYVRFPITTHAPFDDVFRDILRMRNAFYRPELGELEFWGLRVEERWNYDSQCMVLPLFTTLSLLIVGVSRLIYGDWDIAWNVGCYFVGLISVLMLWIDKGLS